MKILAADEATLTTLMRWDKIPSHVEMEYEMWIKFYHMGGASGPLGLNLLIPFLRSMGFEPPVVGHQDSMVTDWRTIENDIPVLVDIDGELHEGLFKGQISFGDLAVHLAGSSEVREFNKRYVSPKRLGPPGTYVQEEDYEPEELPPAAQKETSRKKTKATSKRAVATSK